MTKDNNLLGKFHLDGIPPMRRGEPQIVVTYDIDANSMLNVTAKEVSKGIEQSISIKNDSGRLSQSEVERMVKEAEQYKAEDEKTAKRVQAKNALENYAYSIRNMIDDPKTKLGDDDKKTLKDACDESIKWLEGNDSADTEEFESKRKELEAKVNPIMQKMYAQNAQAGQGGMPGMPQTGMPQTGMPQTNSSGGGSEPIIEEDDIDIADVD